MDKKTLVLITDDMTLTSARSKISRENLNILKKKFFGEVSACKIVHRQTERNYSFISIRNNNLEREIGKICHPL